SPGRRCRSTSAPPRLPISTAPRSSSMEGCLPGSERRARLAVSALSAWALLGAGCSGRTIVAVDPFPCADASAPGCPAADLLNDLIGYWRLNDAPGSATARDYSVWGNDGTLVGLDPATAW